MLWGDPRPLATGYLDPTCLSLQNPAIAGEQEGLLLDLDALADLATAFDAAVGAGGALDIADLLGKFQKTLRTVPFAEDMPSVAGASVIGSRVPYATAKGSNGVDPIAEMVAALAGLCPMDPPTTHALGLVDFSIAFLNQRFRKADGTTRFEMLWLQDRDVAHPPTYGQALGSGTLLLRADINAMIERHTLSDGRLDEAAAYAEILRLPRGLRNTHMQRFGHGTAVLDQMSGAARGELDDVTLYGVDVPTEIITDTSGARLMPAMMVGITSMILFSFFVERARGQEAKHPLVLNASLSFTGAPSSPRNPNAQMLVHLMSLFQTNATKHRDIKLTVPAGNHLQDQVHARADADTELQWVIPPDDRTPSVMEITQVGEQALDLVSVTVTPPGSTPLTVPIPAVGSFCDLTNADGHVIARLSRPSDPSTPFIADWPDHLVLKVRANAQLSGDAPLAPAGTWRVSVTGSQCECLFWIRRDDTLAGFASSGRQSRFRDSTYRQFDGAGDYALNDLTVSNTRRDGTLSALAHANGVHGIVAVGDDPYRFSGRTNGAAVSQAMAEESRTKGGPNSATRFGASALRVHGTSLASGIKARVLAGLDDGRGPHSPPRQQREF